MFKLHTYDYINPMYDDMYNGMIGSDFYGNNLFLTYENGISSGTGDDIWAKIWSLKKINFNEEGFIKPITTDYLHANYPNPFNTTTKIVYEILAYHKVKLAVYNILGQEVQVLVDKDQEKGIYEVNFDASNLPSGIYFCRLEAFNTSVRKMILLK